MKRITIDDVAAATGVSRQTVSRAINDKGEISPETKERILQTVRELGYRPNRLAQGMVTQRTRTVGLVIPDITNLFFPEVARGVQDTARLQDYNAVLCNTDDQPAEEIRALQSLAAQGVDGIILMGSAAADAELTRFVDTYSPIVMLNRAFRHPHVASIMVNNERGAYLAVDHLFARGHRHIGMLANVNFTRSQVRRVRGYQNALAQNGIPAREELITDGIPTLRGGYEAMQRLLTAHPQVTAVFAYNDLMGLGALRAARDLGCRVPADVAVVGFDDIAMAAMATPSLSSVSVDKHAIGRQAMMRVLEMLQQPTISFADIVLDVELIERESTAPTPT